MKIEYFQFLRDFTCCCERNDVQVKVKLFMFLLLFVVVLVVVCCCYRCIKTRFDLSAQYLRLFVDILHIIYMRRSISVFILQANLLKVL